MKKQFLLYVLLVFGALGYSQNPAIFEIDENGKIFHKNQSVLEKNNSSTNSPEELLLDWSSPDFDVSENPTEDSNTPRMAIYEQNAYLVFNDQLTNGLQKILFRKRNENGEWSELMFVDRGGEIGERNNHFPAIAASPNGDLHVSYNVWAFENVRNYVGYSHYIAATDTWEDGVKISDAGGTVNHTTSNHDIYSTDDNLPVVVWGFDNRENESYEEIYMTYFDGNDWSADIPVSNINDNQNAGFPYIQSIGDKKAILVYSENTSGGMELKYKIYDETSHELSDEKSITLENIGNNNYKLISSPTGEVMIFTMHKEPGTATDVIRVYDYDRGNDSFALSENRFEIDANAGQLYKHIAVDCNTTGDCAIVFSDYSAETLSFMPYYPNTGFGDPEVIVEERPELTHAPSALFDIDGNLHVGWADYRHDDGQGWDEREVIHKIGINTTIGIADHNLLELSVYPNPSENTFTIQTTEKFDLQIIDVLGKKVQSETVSGTTQINHNLPAGTYFLKFSNAAESVVKKLVVK